MVKKEELMIGDYVLVSGTPLQIAALGTVKAGFLDGKGEMFYHDYDNIHPIPLTDGILKKTGFRFYDYNDPNLDIISTENNTSCAVFCEKDGMFFIEILKKKDSGDLETSYQNKGIRYYHELQHALRLCGIERRIEP